MCNLPGTSVSNAPARAWHQWSVLRGVVVDPFTSSSYLRRHALGPLEDRRTKQPESMTKQAERLLKLKGEFRGADKCGPKWPGRGSKHCLGREGKVSNTARLQRYSSMERVTGIEPALSAWEEFLSHRVSVSCTILVASATPWCPLPAWSCGPCVARSDQGVDMSGRRRRRSRQPTAAVTRWGGDQAPRHAAARWIGR
jgi:hypothetical protein